MKETVDCMGNKVSNLNDEYKNIQFYFLQYFEQSKYVQEINYKIRRLLDKTNVELISFTTKIESPLPEDYILIWTDIKNHIENNQSDTWMYARTDVYDIEEYAEQYDEYTTSYTKFDVVAFVKDENSIKLTHEYTELLNQYEYALRECNECVSTLELFLNKTFNK